MKRRSAILTAPKTFKIVEEEIPELKADEVQIKVAAIGLCHTDMPAYLGTSAMGLTQYGHMGMIQNVSFPRIVGHESVGVVEAVGKDVTGFQIGDYVGGTSRVPGFSSHLVANQRALIPIPKTVGEVKYCLVEPLTCIANIVQVANPRLGDCVVVVGCGMMGLMTIAGLSHSGAGKIIAIDIQEDRLEQAKSMGATHVLNPAKCELTPEIDRLTDSLGADIVVEITGGLKGLKTAVQSVRYGDLYGSQGRGKILIPSMYGKAETWDPEIGYELMFRAPVLHATHPAYCEDYMATARAGVEAYVKGILPLRTLITHEFSLENIAQGFEMLECAKDGYIKGIITP